MSTTQWKCLSCILLLYEYLMKVDPRLNDVDIEIQNVIKYDFQTGFTLFYYKLYKYTLHNLIH